MLSVLFFLSSMGIFAWSVLTEPPAAQNAYLVFSHCLSELLSFSIYLKLIYVMVVELPVDVCHIWSRDKSEYKRITFFDGLTLSCLYWMLVNWCFLWFFWTKAWQVWQSIMGKNIWGTRARISKKIIIIIILWWINCEWRT